LAAFEPLKNLFAAVSLLLAAKQQLIFTKNQAPYAGWIS
jgi:hypothetical protein